jgi:hypothetical protein
MDATYPVHDLALVPADDLIDVVRHNRFESVRVADGRDPGGELRVPDWTGQ